jgi:peptide deformylase
MLDTLHANPAVGVAAPQVGVSLQVIVIQIPGEEDIILINPEVVKRKGERAVQEGCLSIPGYQGRVKRSASVTVKGTNRQGKEVRLKATGLLAQALEHEIDHLGGTLYVDHLISGTKLQKVELKRR